jgi:hypothetical protein
MVKERSTQFPGQDEGEEVLLMFRKHPVVMRRGLIVSALGLLAGPLYVLALSYVRPESLPSPTMYLVILLASFVFAGLLFFPTWMGWFFSVYLVTTQRFVQIYQKGFFHKSVSDTPLAQIQSVNYEIAGMQETLLGFGTIVVQTYIGDIILRDIHHPEKLSRNIANVLKSQNIIPNDFPVNSN